MIFFYINDSRAFIRLDLKGCEGGYPFLAAKHATEFGVVSEACEPYEGRDKRCDISPARRHMASTEDELGEGALDACASRYFAKNYRYVGGYYGAGNEENIMHEIQQGGPVVFALQSPSSL